MSIRDELVAGTATGCKLCAFISVQDEDAQGEWRAALALPVKVVGNLSVVRALARRGLAIDEASVRRHRRHDA